MARRIDHDQVRAMHANGASIAAIAAELHCDQRYAQLIVGSRVGTGHTHTRIAPIPINGRALHVPPFDHEAIMAGHTMFPGSVAVPGGERVFKSGFNSAKIGKRITKGRWKDFEVYTLTLEERATCPVSCKHWRSCYGNSMHLAQRWRHGAALEARLRIEVGELARKHPRGFAIRLHNLGDFYSVAYVEMWRELLNKHPQLHAFGFSARWDYHGDPIAKALIDLIGKRWSRFAIRLSNAPIEQCATRSVEHPYQIPKGTIWCPQQAGKTAACSTCALCWQSTKNIAFVQH